MKKLLFTQLMLLLLASTCFMACDDGEDDPKVLLPKLDGFYVYGTNTIAANPSEPAARMALAILDHGKAPNEASQDGVYGKYMYIGAASKISFAEVVDEVGTVYGSDDQAVDNGTDLGYSVNDDIVHGSLQAKGDEIEVAEEGLYYVFVNTNTGLFIIQPIVANIIGDATPLEWGGGTALPLKSTNKDETIFEGTEIKMMDGHGYRYRINDGWHTYFEENVMHTLSSIGVAEGWVEANAKDHNDLGFFLENAPHKVTGMYTIQLKFTASTGLWTETKTKTGNVLVNYTDYSMAIIGDATASGSWNGDGTGGYEAKKPTKAGNVYTWTWTNVPFIADKEFIFLKDATWGGLQIDYLGAAVSGTGISEGKIIDATAAPVSGPYHNFHVITGGNFDVTLVINAETEGRTVTITTK